MVKLKSREINRTMLVNPKRHFRKWDCLDTGDRSIKLKQKNIYIQYIYSFHIYIFIYNKSNWNSYVLNFNDYSYSLAAENFSKSLRDFLTIESWDITSAGIELENSTSLSILFNFLSASITVLFDLLSTMQSTMGLFIWWTFE